MAKLLFVDDSKAVHMFIKQSFAKSPHNIEHAMSGEEALEKIEAFTAQIQAQKRLTL